LLKFSLSAFRFPVSGFRMRLGYLYSRYPVISQTFCDTEMLALEKLGFSLEIGSVYPPLSSLRHAHASRLRAPVRYAPPQAVLRVWEKNARASGQWPGALVDLHEENYGWRYKPAQRARNALYFAELFGQAGVDHFHVHFANRAAHTALFLKEISGIPFSMTAHGQDFMADLRNDDLLREICAAATFVAVETNYSGQLLAQRCPEAATKIYRVFNGIDLQNFPAPLPVSPGKLTRILSVGRLVPFKGFDYLIDACAELARRNLDFTCEIVGDGPEHARLQDKIDNQQLKSRVVLVGSLPREAVFEKMRASDIFSLASVVDHNGASDVFPTVILEAMAAGRPVISTEIAGIPESVVGGETGLLVPPGNSHALAEALAQLIVDLALREKLGQAGRARVEQNFEINKTIPPLLELFQTSSVARPKSAARHTIHRIAYLIDRWPDDSLPQLERELKEMKRRNISIQPIVCEFDSEIGLTPEQKEVAPTLEFLPDAMVIEAEWQTNRALTQRLEDDHASGDERIPAALFLREARFALSLRQLLKEKNVSHIHATSSRALVCANILRQLVDLTVSATIEPQPPLSPEWIKGALRQCRGGRLSDPKLLRRRSSSFLFDKAALHQKLLQSVAGKIGIDLTGHGSFWQEWSELLVRWSRERAETV
jgi:glycosyltransferase involved in cell wall biosynthesis